MRIRSAMMVAGAVVVAGLAGAARADDAAEVQRLRQENAALKARVAELEKQLGVTREKLADTQAQADAAEAQRAQLAAEAAEADRQRREYYIAREFDSDANRTKLVSRASRLKVTFGAKYRHWINLAAEHEGKTAGSPPAQIKLVIQTAFSGTEYRGLDDITLTADGQPIKLTVSDYDNVFRSSGSTRTRTRRDDETITVAVPIEAAVKISKASNVSGKIGRSKVQLDREQIEAFEAILNEFEAE